MTVNRLQKLNELWMKMTAPKEGDNIKFKVKGSNEVREGKITAAFKYGNKIQYKVWSMGLTAQPDGIIEIIECNGVKFKRAEKTPKGFKPL
jgi:hypothetical protein